MQNLTTEHNGVVTVELSVEHSMKVDVDTWNGLKMSRFRWRLLPGRRYAYAYIGSVVLVHRFILGAIRGQQVDHINGDSLDNRRCNLRFATQSQNMANMKGGRRPNKTRFKGVSFCSGKWQAVICFERKRYNAGRHHSAERAAMAYDRAALALAGQFAALNFESRRKNYLPKLPSLMSAH